MRSGWRPLAVLTLTFITTQMLSACTALSFGLANVPAWFSRVQRTTDLAFGADARQRLDIYRPPAFPGSARPVIVFWYGGSWDNGSKKNYRFVGVALSRLGYLTVLPDYRLYPQVRFPLFIDDGARAVAWVQRHAADYGGDPRRIILMGHSAGAHLAAMLAINHHYLEQAGVDRSRVIGLIGLSGPYGLTPNTPSLNDIFSAPFTPHDWQVLPYVSVQAPPALLLHGRADKLVSVRNTEALAAALREQQVPVETRIYDARGHIDMLAALSLPGRLRAPVLLDIAQFLRSLEAAGGSSAGIGAAPAHLTRLSPPRT